MQWAVSAQLIGTTRDYTQAVAPRIERFAELAYQAGARKARADYEREHLRHTVPLPDALKVMQDQIAGACIKVVERHEIPVGNSLAGEIACQLTYKALSIIREELRDGEWRRYLESK